MKEKGSDSFDEISRGLLALVGLTSPVDQSPCRQPKSDLRFVAQLTRVIAIRKDSIAWCVLEREFEIGYPLRIVARRMLAQSSLPEPNVGPSCRFALWFSEAIGQQQKPFTRLGVLTTAASAC